VIWAGTLKIVDLEDPNRSFKDNAANDIEKQKLGRVLLLWYELLPDTCVTLDELDTSSRRYGSNNQETLYLALLEVAGGDYRVLSRRLLSWYLRKCENRIIGGLKLVRGPKHYGLDTWKVVQVK
jgi:hypothetical protein